MVQQSPPNAITVQLSHDIVSLGDYNMAPWEGVRGLALTIRATVGVGPGLASVQNVSLQAKWESYLHSSVPMMFQDLGQVPVLAVTSLAPVPAASTALPSYPGLAQLRITASANGTPIQIHSPRGVGNDVVMWFYIVEKEAALSLALLARLVAKQPGGG